MKPPFDGGLADNVTIHRRQHLRAGRVRPEAELGVQREKLDRVVMINASRARSHETGMAAQIVGLNGAIRKRGLGGNAFGKRMHAGGNIERHPMQHILYALA